MSLFTGNNGASDGTVNGFSASIPSGIRSIAVHGEFDGAKIILSRYSDVSNSWFDTAAIWDTPDVFQGLRVEGGIKYRLEIEGAGASTSIIAEV